MKEIFVTAHSGICNRLFVVLSALRISKEFGHKLTVFWCERVGRAGIEYDGSVLSDWDDYFLPIRDMKVIPIIKDINLQYDSEIDLTKALPEDHTGDIYVKMRKFNKQPSVFVPNDLMKILFSAKLVDATKEKIVVKKMTKPFGVKTDKNLEKYIDYIKDKGVHKKDDFLKKLSDLTKFIQPKFYNNEIKKITSQFKDFNEVWGIHIRGTDLKNKGDLFKDATEIIEKADDNIGFFLTSDEDISSIKKKFKNIITFDHHKKTINSLEGNRLGLIDLFCLSKCNRIYGTSGSSFSMMSWILSDLDSDYYIM